MAAANTTKPRKSMAEIDALKKDPAAYWHEYDHGGPPGETQEQRRMRMYDVIPHDMDDNPPPPRPRIEIVAAESNSTRFISEFNDEINSKRHERVTVPMYDVIPRDLNDKPPPRVKIVEVDCNSTRFINEFNNEIDISIEILSKRHGRVIVPCVLITMDGPTSTMQNHITLKEAQELHRVLAVFLKDVKD